MNRYQPLSVMARSQYGEDPVDLDLSVTDERDAVDGGHLELVPRPYRVLSDNFSGGPEGSVYSAAFLKEIEAALIQGGHIERVDEPQGGPVEPLVGAGGENGPEVVVPADEAVASGKSAKK